MHFDFKRYEHLKRKQTSSAIWLDYELREYDVYTIKEGSGRKHRQVKVNKVFKETKKSILSDSFVQKSPIGFRPIGHDYENIN